MTGILARGIRALTSLHLDPGPQHPRALSRGGRGEDEQTDEGKQDAHTRHLPSRSLPASADEGMAGGTPIAWQESSLAATTSPSSPGRRAAAALGEDADEVACPHPRSASMSSGRPLFPWLLRGPSSLPGALQALPEGTRPAPSQAVSLARRLSSSRYAWSRKKSGHFSSKGTVARVHPRLGNLFGKVHDPGLKPEASCRPVEGRVPHRRTGRRWGRSSRRRPGRWRDASRTRLSEGVSIASRHGEWGSCTRATSATPWSGESELLSCFRSSFDH